MSQILDNLFCAKGNRWGLRENFEKRPALNAVIDLPGSDSTSPTAAAFLAYNIANRDFEVLGTNMTTALCTFALGGGITMTTAGAADDQSILLPHLNTNQTAWSLAAQWNSAKSPRFETVLETGASITNYILWAGLKLTNTQVSATDDDQVFVRLEDDDATYPGQFVIVHSRDGTDTVTPTGITAAVSTQYKIVIDVDSDRKFTVTINNKNINHPASGATFPALVTGESLIPYIGIENDGGAGAAKAVTVRYLEMTRSIA